jgi:hypothetical protein
MPFRRVTLREVQTMALKVGTTYALSLIAFMSYALNIPPAHDEGYLSI